MLLPRWAQASKVSRRFLLLAPAGIAFAAARSESMDISNDATSQGEPFRSLLDRYLSFGSKQSGGVGDNACGEWVEGFLMAQGLATRRQAIQVPSFAEEAAFLKAGSFQMPILPQFVMTPTEADGVRGPLVCFETNTDPTLPNVAGAIAALVLPFARWSSIAQFGIATKVKDLFAKGAKAVVLVTTGPTGEAVFLNTPLSLSFRGPVAIAAPNLMRKVFEQAGAAPEAFLALNGRSATRGAFNVIAKRDVGGAKTIVISTPRSGWGPCAGERGPGIAIFLELARWLSTLRVKFNLVFVCTSGHEYEGFGGDTFLNELAPQPAETHLWLHLGAGIAARDWHETGAQLRPLKSADPQRFLVATPDHMNVVSECFEGLPGLDVPYSSGDGAQGELKQILAAGHRSALGAFGAHRFHHTLLDDGRCVGPELIYPAFTAFQKFIATAMG